MRSFSIIILSVDYIGKNIEIKGKDNLTVETALFKLIF